MERADASLEFREAQDVAVGILEPSDFGAARGSPDAFGILCGQAIAFEMHAFLFESGNGCSDIRDLPPENGERLRLEGRGDVGNAEHYAVGVEGQGKIVLAQDMQSQHVFVKWPRFLGVESRGESHDFVRGKHAILPVGARLSVCQTRQRRRWWRRFVRGTKPRWIRC